MHTRRLLVAAMAVALVTAACSSGGDNSVTTSAAGSATTASGSATTAAGSASTASGSATSSASASTRPATSSPATTATGGSTTSEVPIEDQAQAALLTPAEIGPGFTAGTWMASDPKQPTPCGTPSADATVPPQVQVGAVSGLARTNQALQQEIGLYNDEDEAGQAFQAGSAGLTCTTGTVTFTDGTQAPIAITPGVDVTKDVGGDRATAWQLRGGGIQGVLVAVQLSSIVVTFQFTAPDTATDLQPAPLAVAKAGMDKILKS
jgi:hypothetical protein